LASKRKPVDDTAPTGKNGTLFINYDLDDNMRKQFKVWREAHINDLEEMLNNAVDAGYQVSLKKDTYNDCMGAFLIAKDTKTENDGFILTGRGSTVIGALFGVFFRHYTVFETVWPTHNRRTSSLDDD
jgi:hypothetical protein